MSPVLILGCVGAYFALLLAVAWWAGRGATNAGYFLGDKQSPWWLIAFGVIGDTLSGVTFISVPGEVGTRKFAYLQVVLGYVLGYAIIATVLLPLYYRLQLTSIYSYLGLRFDTWVQRVGSFFFLLSRTLGAAARLYLAVSVFQHFVFDRLGVPFVVTAGAILLLMLAYTWHGGIKTLVWTDLLQSGFLVLGLLLSLAALGQQLGLGPMALAQRVAGSPMSQVFFWDWRAPNHFLKLFLSGALIAVVMTGLDQNSMQKNLTCRTLREAQKNIFAFVPVLVLVNLLFLSLGALLFEVATARGIAIPARTDLLFPTLALQHLGSFAAFVFVLGLTAATFNSADSVLTTLTTSFCFDFLALDRRTDLDETGRTRIRHRIHIVFAGVLLAVILGFWAWSQNSVISLVLKMAGYTYGPLLGLFALGLFTRQQIGGPGSIAVCIAAPVCCAILDQNSRAWLNGYVFSQELLLINGIVTVAGLLLFCRRPAPVDDAPWIA